MCNMLLFFIRQSNAIAKGSTENSISLQFRALSKNNNNI